MLSAQFRFQRISLALGVELGAIIAVKWIGEDAVLQPHVFDRYAQFHVERVTLQCTLGVWVDQKARTRLGEGPPKQALQDAAHDVLPRVLVRIHPAVRDRAEGVPGITVASTGWMLQPLRATASRRLRFRRRRRRHCCDLSQIESRVTGKLVFASSPTLLAVQDFCFIWCGVLLCCCASASVAAKPPRGVFGRCSNRPNALNRADQTRHCPERASTAL